MSKEIPNFKERFEKATTTNPLLDLAKELVNEGFDESDVLNYFHDSFISTFTPDCMNLVNYIRDVQRK